MKEPYKWKKPEVVGLCFIGDLFDKEVVWWGDHYGERIMEIFDVMTKNPHHDYLILTKQAFNMKEWFEEYLMYDPVFPNFWWGVSVTDQEDADRIIPELFKIPGKHWVSHEPALGYIDYDKYMRCQGCGYTKKDMATHGDHYLCDEPSPVLDWLVIGAESGQGRYPMPLEWAHDTLSQAQDTGTPIYIKQLDIGKCLVKNPDLFPPELKVLQVPWETSAQIMAMIDRNEKATALSYVAESKS
jgi:protein gp37